MKMNIKNNLAILLAGLSIVSTSVYAGELNSLTHEVTLNDYDGGDEQIEWTLAKGSYQLKDNLKFWFDVDKDFFKSDSYLPKLDKETGETALNYETSKIQGWDSEFAFVQTGHKLGSFDVTFYYMLRYDAHWNASNGSHESIATQYIFSPTFSKDVNIAGKDYSFTIETWAQVGKKKTKSFQELNGVETSFYLSGDVSDHWNIELAWYDLYYYNKDKDNYALTIETEDTVTYTVPLKGGFTFDIEAYTDTSYNTDTEKLDGEFHIAPELKYIKKVNDNFSWHAAVSYEIYNYDFSKTKDSSLSEAWQDNEMEASIGFKVK